MLLTKMVVFNAPAVITMLTIVFIALSCCDDTVNSGVYCSVLL